MHIVFQDNDDFLATFEYTCNKGIERKSKVIPYNNFSHFGQNGNLLHVRMDNYHRWHHRLDVLLSGILCFYGCVRGSDEGDDEAGKMKKRIIELKQLRRRRQRERH